ncbi:aldo/keto reductase [Corynebacterium sp.]|uniref:aldo/keto reductase n=2 Tax=Corynebacterium sp. TaxID=1720 RepID=UPI0028AAF78E|nr:aldo/keto reductase [Corynebacterium sp.]
MTLRKRKLLIGSLCSASLVAAGCSAAPGESSRSETGTAALGSSPSERTGPSPEDDIFDLGTGSVMLNSGFEMPVAGLGNFSLSEEEAFDSVSAFLAEGGRLIDTAYIYGNEESIGDAIRASGVPREDIFVTTKIHPNQFDDPEGAIEDAVDALGVGYIDMMLLHHPGPGDVDAYRAMEGAVDDGVIRSIGLSNWYIEELEEFLPQVDTTPAMVQNEIHPHYQEKDVVPYIQELGTVVQGYFPFGGRDHVQEVLREPVISEIAETHDVSPAQVILRWNLQRGVVVIPGSSSDEHIRENLDILDFTLSDQEMEHISDLDRDEKYSWY